MDIERAGSQPSTKGSAEWFTGSVRVDPLFEAPGPALVSGASVTFEPGARTAWQTHPLRQTLIITAGFGWLQREGGPVRANPAYGGDGTRIDLAYAIYAIANGRSEQEVRQAISSRDLSHKGSDKRQMEYVERTVRKAQAVVSGQARGR